MSVDEVGEVEEVAKPQKTMKFQFFTSLFFILYSYTGLSQEQTIVLPFQEKGKLIIVQATVEGQTGYFVVDTGVSALVLNGRYFQGKPVEKQFFTVDGRSEPVEELIVDFVLGDWKQLGLNSELIDLRSVEVYTGLPIFGNIGAGLFQDRELVIDYVFKEITIYQLNSKGERLESREMHQHHSAELLFRYKGPMPVVDAFFEGQTLRLALDTGAGVNVMNKRVFSRLRDQMEVIGDQNLGSFGYRTGRVASGLLKNLQIGDQFCPPMATVVVSLDALNSSLQGVMIDGILGYEFLSRYRTAINFRKKEIRLWTPELVKNQFLASRKE